jgi:energy-coupling factor transporter ATP-binding protein EcfA2
LNESQATIFVVVTHDPSIARQTSRVIVMAVGRIVREDRIGSPIEEGLKVQSHSKLGRHIREGDPDSLIGSEFTKFQFVVFREVFKQNSTENIRQKKCNSTITHVPSLYSSEQV